VPISLVLADDHPLVLDGLESLFHLERDIVVVSRCRDGAATLRAVREHRPDVLILDIRMPQGDGLSVLRAMKKENLASRVVIFTAALDEDEVVEAIHLGVRGVVLKEMAPESLVHCVRHVFAGGEWLERRSVSRALDKLRKREDAEEVIAHVLTPRELEVVRLVAQGLRNKDIAQRLSVTEGTVKIHLHNTYEKLAVEGRWALSIYARERGLV
jgi:two-component system, NarL family, nitrate/nitrite response regulator NarL